MGSNSPYGIDCEDGVVGALDANGTVTGVLPGHWAGAPVDETNANVTRVWLCETPEACLGLTLTLTLSLTLKPTLTLTLALTLNPSPSPSPNPNPNPNPNPDPIPNPNPNPIPKQACLGGAASVCRTGHEGVLCAGCLPGYTRRQPA